MKRRLIRLGAILTVLALASTAAQAHEIRPVLLQLEEMGGGRVEAMLKLPVFRNEGLAAVQPQFPAGCTVADALPPRQGKETFTKRWYLDCAEGLQDQQITMQGFSVLAPDALVLVRFADGSENNYVLTAEHHSARLRKPGQDSDSGTSLQAYIPIGIEHILLGFDHLMFLLGLILVIWRIGAGLRVLVTTVTAFTLAHSITLAAAVLGGVSLPSASVETLIALSVLIVAVELARSLKNPALLTTSLTFRKPWLVAFIFGLLHGFGFAGVLADIGLPAAAQATALLLFNLGVELGQLIFIAAVFALIRVLSFVIQQPVARLSPAMNLCLGAVAAAWVLERLPAVLTL